MQEKYTIAEFFEKSREVYSYFEDEQSKKLFEARLSWGGTGSNNSIDKIVELSSTGTKTKIKEMKKILNNYEKIVLYGAGEIAEYFYDQYDLKQRFDDVIICDRQFETKTKLAGHTVVSPDNMLELNKNHGGGEKYCTIYIICAIPGYNVIKRFLTENQINVDNIIPFCIEETQEQYFDPIIKFDKEEIFVDVGAFDGMTSYIFSRKCPNFKKILAFEPDNFKMEKVKNTFSQADITCFELFEVGLWHKKETLRFSNDLGINGMSSTISESGDVIVECDTLDNLAEDKNVTFIKMDIEGSELNALKGAENIIKKNKPKLAISIYHKNEDIIELPIYIKSLVPEYKFYLRHYTNVETYTVLYAII